MTVQQVVEQARQQRHAANDDDDEEEEEGKDSELGPHRGLAHVWRSLTDFTTFAEARGLVVQRRRERAVRWMRRSIEFDLMRAMQLGPDGPLLREMEQLVADFALPPALAAHVILKRVMGQDK